MYTQQDTYKKHDVVYWNYEDWLRDKMRNPMLRGLESRYGRGPFSVVKVARRRTGKNQLVTIQTGLGQQQVNGGLLRLYSLQNYFLHICSNCGKLWTDAWSPWSEGWGGFLKKELRCPHCKHCQPINYEGEMNWFAAKKLGLLLDEGQFGTFGSGMVELDAW